MCSAAARRSNRISSKSTFSVFKHGVDIFGLEGTHFLYWPHILLALQAVHGGVE
jgi:hypothetical protein